PGRNPKMPSVVNSATTRHINAKSWAIPISRIGNRMARRAMPEPATTMIAIATCPTQMLPSITPDNAVAAHSVVIAAKTGVTVLDHLSVAAGTAVAVMSGPPSCVHRAAVRAGAAQVRPDLGHGGVRRGHDRGPAGAGEQVHGLLRVDGVLVAGRGPG